MGQRLRGRLLSHLFLFVATNASALSVKHCDFDFFVQFDEVLRQHAFVKMAETLENTAFFTSTAINTYFTDSLCLLNRILFMMFYPVLSVQNVDSGQSYQTDRVTIR